MTKEHQHVGQVGCIDGSILELRRGSDEWLLSVGDSEARLSTQAAERLADLLTAGHSPPKAALPSEPVQVEQPPDDATPSEPGARARERVDDLIEAGIISPGAVLTMKHRGSVHHATVAADGSIELEGDLCKTPSEASRLVAGASRNGWRDWKVMDGLSLDDLRWKLRAARFPGEDHTLAESTVQEKQRLALWWVKYAFENGLDPAARNEDAIADLLTRRNYADSTLDSYRRHLDQWFEMYGRRL